MSIIEDFDAWVSAISGEFDGWKIDFKNEALKKGSYRKAINYLNGIEPDLLGHSANSIEQHLTYATRQMLEDVKKDIRDKAMEQEI